MPLQLPEGQVPFTTVDKAYPELGVTVNTPLDPYFTLSRSKKSKELDWNIWERAYGRRLENYEKFEIRCNLISFVQALAEAQLQQEEIPDGPKKRTLQMYRNLSIPRFDTDREK